LSGYLAGGIDGWEATRRPLSAYPARGIDELDPGDPEIVVLDVRQPAEVAAAAIPGSRHIFLGDLPERMAELPPGRTVWTVCRSGHRAAIAASLLDRAGIPVTVVARGGVPDWAAHAASGNTRQQREEVIA
jgi:rhodanese-related sulfurtransferase